MLFMTKDTKSLMVTTLLLFITSLSVNAQKVKVGSDPAVDLTKYRTYAWAQGSAVSNPVINQIIISAVDSEMTSKGLRKVDTDPDLILVTFASTDSELYITNPTWTSSMHSISTGIATGPQSWPVSKGTLVVDLSDAKTKNGVWRGTATHTLEHGPTGNSVKDAKSVEKPIRKAVQKMFKQFPGPSKT